MQQPARIFTADARFSLIDGEKPRLTGYALVWNELSADRGGYQVRLLPGSARFDSPTLALYQHDPKQVLGSTANASLKLSTDAVGVAFALDLPNTSLARDVAELVKSRTITGMSFYMATKPKGVMSVVNGQRIFDAADFLVNEVSVVTRPAFAGTSVGAFSSDLNLPAELPVRVARSLEWEARRFAALRLPAAPAGE